MRRALLAGIAVLLFAAPAVAFDYAREASNESKSNERFADYGTDPGYQGQLALQSLAGTQSLADYLAQNPGATPINPCADAANACAGDTRIYDWGTTHGVVRPIRYVNRNGATISGHLWAALPQNRHFARLPAVLIVAGDLAPEQIYWFAAAALARHGYLVMTYDPQGHGHSDTFGAGTDALRNVDVQQQAACDCIEVPANADAVEQATDALDFLFSSAHHPYVPRQTDGSAYNPATPSPGEAKQVASAAAQTVDGSNPLRALLDTHHVGLAGHSRGAFAVSILGSRDRRARAIVAWDNLLGGALTVPDETTEPVVPRVPALGMSADYYLNPQPYTERPDRQDKSAAFKAYRRAGVDAMELVVRGGTHYEFSYVPNPAFPATLRGIDMATWYAQAWFDKYLRHRALASRRLLTDRWRNDRAEARVDPRGDGNMFSFYYRSHVAIHAGGRLVYCVNLRRGCPALVPRSQDGYRGRYSYLRAAGL